MITNNVVPQNVMHIIETLDVGGAECVLVEIINSMPAYISSTVCCFKHSGDVEKRIKGSVDIISLGKGDGNDLFLPFVLAKMMKARNIDVVHTHNWGVYCESMVAAILAGVPVRIHMAHGGLLHHPTTLLGGFKKQVRRRIEQVISWFVTRIIAVSEDLKSQIVSDIGISEDNILVMRNGIKLIPREKNEEKSLLKVFCLNEEDFIICFVGRLAHVKNIPLLLRAMPEVSSINPSVKLLIVGDGNELDHLRECARELGVEECVKFLGQREHIREILSICHLFVLPSLSEGISISLLEAMSMKLPVIATDVGGNSEVVIDGKTGLLFTSGDLDRLVTHINYFIANPEVCRICGENGFQRVKDDFNLDKNIEKIVSLYHGEG